MNEKIKISISISEKLLNHIEQNIRGKNRTAKLLKCLERGFEIYMKDTDTFTISELKALSYMGGYKEAYTHNPLKKVQFVFEKK